MAMTREQFEAWDAIDLATVELGPAQWRHKDGSELTETERELIGDTTAEELQEISKAMDLRVAKEEVIVDALGRIRVLIDKYSTGRGDERIDSICGRMSPEDLDEFRTLAVVAGLGEV